MNVYRSLGEMPSSFGPSALTIGNFDGIHIGHQHIMRRLLEIAREKSLVAAVLTFDPHPAHILAPERAKRRIMTTPLRLERLAELGIDAVLVLPFNLEFAKLTPPEFVKTVIEDAFHARQVLVGRDFRFGNKQTGNLDTLRALGARPESGTEGFDVEPVEAVLFRGERVSSTAIRYHLERGEVSRACRLLGRPFVLSGEVVSGQGIGSKQTVPTLNLATENEVLPRVGVYVSRTRETGQKLRTWRSITNVGYRPTFGGEGLTVETFLLDPLIGETPRQIAVEFLRWVRAEQRFETPEALKRQIFQDVGVANRLHSRLANLRME